MFCLKLFDTQKEVYQNLCDVCRPTDINAFDVHLDTKEMIEKRFDRVLGEDKEAFSSDICKSIMKEIGRATYVGAYEIKLEFYRRAVITSLNLSTKLALLMEYYRATGVPVATNWEFADSRMWRFLGGLEQEYTIYLDCEKNISQWVAFQNFIKNFNTDMYHKLLKCNPQEIEEEKSLKLGENRRLVNALLRTIEIKPDVEIGKFIRYITSIDDLAYMEDHDIAVEIEEYNSKGQRFPTEVYRFKAEEKNWLSSFYIYAFTEADKKRVKSLFAFTKTNEQIAYDRYQAYNDGRLTVTLEERLNCSDFLKRFDLMFVEAEDFSEWTVINHCTRFLNDFPMSYRHMNLYGVARKDDKYLAFHCYACKNPCFGELFESATIGVVDPEGAEFDEYFVIVIDWAESPRFVHYTNCIQYGVLTRPAKKEIEIFGIDQTIEIFHEWMQKANKITDEWEGVLFDDGTL